MKNLLDYEIKKGVVLKNRLVLAPMTTYSGNDDLTLSEEERIYYEARGKEFGMVITAATAISKQAQAFSHQISIMNDDYLDSMKRLADSIKAGGAKAILQIHHGGRMNLPGLFDGQDIVSASAIKAERSYTDKPRALSNEEVYQVIDDYVSATKRAMLAGFDGVELHGANTYLIQQFFSPHSNRRTDEFGGSLEKRLTFPMKLVKDVVQLRKAMKKADFMIGYRLSPEELEEPGITIDDTLVLVEELSKTDIDYIHLSLGSYKQGSIRNKEEQTPVIKVLQKANIGKKPMIGVGGVESLKQVNEALDLGFDMVAIGMAALVDEKVVSHIIKNQPIKRELDESSQLPTPLRERLMKWPSFKGRGFKSKF
jgi:2,4-dienoyl-CoA reductase-like NADH-dependent reductase (Old Yellow Enzyme family)